MVIFKMIFCFQQNSERKHRTAVFVLVVTEELDEWEDSKSIGMYGIEGLESYLNVSVNSGNFSCVWNTN